MIGIEQHFNEFNKKFKTSNYITEEKFTLKINELIFDFPLKSKADNINLGYMQPKEWFIHEHQNNSLHEPGLVKLLFILAERFKNSKVRFIDIGALYGYFSILATKIFNDVEVLSVEANPYSCKYIESIKKDKKFVVHKTINTFVDAENTAKKKMYINGYKFLNKTSYYIVIFKILIKKLINLFRQKYKIIKPEKVYVKNTSLADLIRNKKKQIDIVKIDTEGYQARFLPPATQNLIDNKAIILLEFDDANEMACYNTTNEKLCLPFIKNGYELYWIEHRAKGTKLKRKKIFDTSMEINSLALLIPSQYI